MSRERTGILVLVILYAVGTIAVLIPSLRPLVLPLSGYNLFLSFLILINSYRWNKALLIGAAVIFMLGFLAEWIGVHTGILFGTYWYGMNLGPKLSGVPFIIGVNWAMLTIISTGISDKWIKSLPLQALLAAGIMTGFDVLMEPVAIRNDFWHWRHGVIPIYNYLCWFVISYIGGLILIRIAKPRLNNTSLALFILIILFFVIQLFV
ncbi:MAG: carotenoid biosynthesis protein [Flavobacteriales bacterium]